MLPLFGGLSPVFLLRLNAKLDLTVDEAMIAKLEENPLIQPLLMDAATLVGATSHVSSDDELEEHLASLAMIHPPADQLLKALIKHISDEVGISITHP